MIQFRTNSILKDFLLYFSWYFVFVYLETYSLYHSHVKNLILEFDRKLWLIWILHVYSNNVCKNA